MVRSVAVIDKSDGATGKSIVVIKIGFALADVSAPLIAVIETP